MRTATLAAAAIVVIAAFAALAYAVHDFTSDPGIPSYIGLRADRARIRPGEVDYLRGVAIGARPRTKLLVAAETAPFQRHYRVVGSVPALAAGGRFQVAVSPRSTTVYRVVDQIDHAFSSRPVRVAVGSTP